MEIGFINFNHEALARANKVMKLLQGQGAIDELGLGRIRDAFSNTMFPGLSTLQTHAKYFLLMPALYSHLEHSNITDPRDAREKVRKYEIALTRRLFKGSPEGTKGIIGAESLDTREGYVKYDPAYIYQAGMETFGLVKSAGNIFRLLAERATANGNTPRRQSGTAESGDDAGETSGNKQIFMTCGEDYDFREKSELRMSLSHKEASFLRRQIIAAVPDTMLGMLLDSDLYKTACELRFEDLDGFFTDNIPDRYYETYILARRFSRFAQLLRTRYAMLFDLAVGANRAEDERQSFFSQLETNSAEFTPEAIGEIISFVSPIVSEGSCKRFCLNASALIAEKDWEKLDKLIENREIEIKTLKRSKLRNAREFEPGKPFESPKPMSFRWDTIVCTVLKEIREGLDHE